MKMLSEDCSKRITSLRFLLIVFVVFIHNNLSAEKAINYYHLSFSEPIGITWFKVFVAEILGSAAVPLFFLFAGYLQFCKREKYPRLLAKRTRSLLVPYLLWTFLNVALYASVQSFPPLASFFGNAHNLVRNWGVMDWLKLFWTHLDVYPLVPQFWFLRNLIVLIVLSPILSWAARIFPLGTFTCISLCYLNDIPLNFGVSLFFFMAGWFFAEHDISFFHLADKAGWLECALFLILSLLAHMLFPNNSIMYHFDTIVSCVFFLKLSNAIVLRPHLFRTASYLSGFSFFLFAVHTPFLESSLRKISYKVIPLHGWGCLVQFIATSLICIVIGISIGIVLRKVCPPIFKLLNGSR